MLVSIPIELVWLLAVVVGWWIGGYVFRSKT